MECQNCKADLERSMAYCPFCGGKIIRNRLTLSSLWNDISVQIFNVDNTFLKTFRHMFTIPHLVIGDYIAGVRKRYMNPLGYFAIAITLSGFLFYFLKNVYHVSLTENSFTNTDNPKLEFIFDYQGLASYLLMPVYALFTWLLFLDKNKLNYVEHLVANAYITGQMFFAQFLVTLPLFGFFDVRYDIYNWIFLVISIVYQFYIFKEIHQIGIWTSIIRGIAYTLLILLVTTALGSLIILLCIALGYVSVSDFSV